MVVGCVPCHARRMDEQHPHEVDLEITGIAHGGVSVARLDGRVVFVTDTLPGERVRARLSDTSKRSFWRADTVEVIEASPHRTAHVWAEAGIDRDPSERAGGAEFGHIALTHQRALKAEVLTDSLARFAGLRRDVEVLGVEDDDATDGTGWRTRVRAHVDADGVVGPFASRSHRVIPVAGYPLAVPAAAALIPSRLAPGTAEWVDVVAPSAGEPVVLTGSGRTPHGGAGIVERVGDREFRLDASGFWQVHRNAAAVLSSAVASAVASDGRFDPAAANHDLYGGVGLLAAALAGVGGASTRVTSVESSATATEFASENLADWIGARAETARVDRYLDGLARTASPRERERLRAATIVLDPPRQGAGAAVVDRLLELRPQTLVYVACDPVALSRDLGRLLAGGYELGGLTGYDLFPHTHHVEAVAVLHRG